MKRITDEEQDACTPTNEEVDAYLAEPDDAIAAILTPQEKRLAARTILYGRKVADAQLAADEKDCKRAKKIAYKKGYVQAIKDNLGEVQKAREEERKKYQQHMQGFPHSLYPIKEKCLCAKWKCTWYQPYREEYKEGFPIGWCKRFEPDPDAGYVIAYQLPPCVVWAVNRKALDMIKNQGYRRIINAE